MSVFSALSKFFAKVDRVFNSESEIRPLREDRVGTLAAGKQLPIPGIGGEKQPSSPAAQDPTFNRYSFEKPDDVPVEVKDKAESVKQEDGAAVNTDSEIPPAPKVKRHYTPRKPKVEAYIFNTEQTGWNIPRKLCDKYFKKTKYQFWAKKVVKDKQIFLEMHPDLNGNLKWSGDSKYRVYYQFGVRLNDVIDRRLLPPSAIIEVNEQTGVLTIEVLPELPKAIIPPTTSTATGMESEPIVTPEVGVLSTNRW
jgi:hypothetical protein